MAAAATLSSLPIVIIGAGGIVRDAHLPAYRKAGLHVVGIYDLIPERARTLAQQFDLPTVFTSITSAISSAPSNTVFDIAVPPSEFLAVLSSLPEGSTVLLQKPMGQTITEARKIRDLCNDRHFTAAVNFQLRFAPAIAKARQMIADGAIGDMHDMEVRVTVYTPWQMWTFLEGSPRVEILHHSVHYIDLVRSFLGDPQRVFARTLKHPLVPKLASTRSNIILDYGESLRANITTNHGHNFGFEHQESYVKWEGASGAIKAQLGLLMDYPKGQPDYFATATVKDGVSGPWENLPVEGSWFPDAFAQTMQSLVDFVTGKSHVLPTSVNDAYKTMAVVEAAYDSNDHGGASIRY